VPTIDGEHDFVYFIGRQPEVTGHEAVDVLLNLIEALADPAVEIRLAHVSDLVEPLRLANEAGVAASVLLNDFAERSGFEVEIALDSEARGSACPLHFGEDKIATLLFVAADVSKEPEVFLIRFAFGGEPSPIVPRAEELGMLCSVASYVLLVRIAAAEFARQAPYFGDLPGFLMGRAAT